MASGSSALALFARTGLSLAVVLGLLWLAARGLQARGGKGVVGLARTKKQAPIEVLSRHGLARGTQVAVVRAAGRTMVLGITPNAMQVLADDGAELALVQEDAVAQTEGDTKSLQPGWKPVLDALRERTVRRT